MSASRHADPVPVDKRRSRRPDQKFPRHSTLEERDPCIRPRHSSDRYCLFDEHWMFSWPTFNLGPRLTCRGRGLHLRNGTRELRTIVIRQRGFAQRAQASSGLRANEFWRQRANLAEAGPTALVGIAISLHQGLAFGKFDSQLIVSRRDLDDLPEPCLDAPILDLKAQRGAAQTAQRGEAAKQQETADGRRRYAAPGGESSESSVRAGRSQEPPAKARRQRPANLLDPRLDELTHLDQILRVGAHLTANAFGTATPSFHLRHAHHVLEAHPQCQRARGRRRQLRIRYSGRIERKDLPEPIQKSRGIGVILIVR